MAVLIVIVVVSMKTYKLYKRIILNEFLFKFK